MPCIDGDCSFHNKDGSLKTEDQCARTHCGTNSIYTRNPWVSPLVSAACLPGNSQGCLDYLFDPNKQFSHFVGMTAAGLAMLTGGNCGVVHDLIACETGWLDFYGGSGTQYGDTFISSRRLADITAPLAAHEKHHRDAQWHKYGAAFPVLYFAAMYIEEEILGMPCNMWERAAERASNGGGGYSC